MLRSLRLGRSAPLATLQKVETQQARTDCIVEILAPLQSRNKQDACPNPYREQLLDAVQRHFTAQPKQLDELQVIVGFMQAAKRMKTTMKVA
ncbi:hypothetical protein ZEAMMB73_Zm00001d013832 [Zea mays]|uniref:Histone deacetylase complex subunit SAP30 Sin3 binding domain-containing protein n=1 Tax=Zea mays TaxID=4577 RepID=A0A1D6GMK6_MAIZE|nr:hypothetical protein ZEAMMB73_Zm00001d013832 [Zea mays]